MQTVIAPRLTRARTAPAIAATLALVGIPLTCALAFFWAPTSAIGLAGGGTQYDFAQKIFYVHVPIAFAAYLAFFVGAWNGLLQLWRGDEAYDIRSYVGIHVGVVFGTLVLITGSVWARAAWGTWWNWGDRQLLVFVILYLYYAAYFMLRFSLEPGRQRMRVSSVYAVLGVVLVPLSFLAIRIASTLIHPIVITRDGLQMTSEMGITFVIGIVAMLALCIYMMQLETTVKLRALRLTALRRGENPRTEAGRLTNPGVANLLARNELEPEVIPTAASPATSGDTLHA
ncbi:MAG: cytochrome c biogenesis protein CcsA [Thermoleophilia bacterium]|nr:cytochrome c biogenesis protein CcsA [Thermoleophilia bacterium]